MWVDKRICCVESCPNTTNNCNNRFFLTPKIPNRVEKWLKALKLKPNLHQKKKYFCSDHFEDRFFTCSLKKRLCRFAVPTLQYKVQPSESDLLAKCMEAHFVWNTMVAPNLKSSKDVQSNSDMFVVASMYLTSDDKGSTINVKSRDEQAVLRHKNLERKDLEKTVNEYLKKRYLIDNQEEHRYLHNSVTKTKNSTLSVITQQSYKENCSSNKQILPETEPSSVNDTKSKQVEIHPYKQQNLSPPASGIYDSNQTRAEEITNSIYKTNTVQVNNVTTNKTDQKEVGKLPCLQHKFNTPVSTSVKPLSNEPIRLCAQGIPSTLSNPHTQLLPIKIEENLLETDADCDMYAARIAEVLKRMKNPACRAKTHFNIEKILLEAKSGIYNI